MRFAILFALLAAPVAILAAGQSSQGKKEQKTTELSKVTRQNLDKAMHGEAFAYAKYMLYAKQARESGHKDLAKLFEDTAKTEHEEHLNEEAELAGVMKGDVENLRDAIQGETYETESMYPQFAREARKAGDVKAAERFEEVAKDEAKHRDAFKVELEKLQAAPGGSK